jgi:hypothetical protein
MNSLELVARELEIKTKKLQEKKDLKEEDIIELKNDLVGLLESLTKDITSLNKKENNA